MSGRILIIDDDQTVSEGLRALLEDDGFDVLAIPSPIGLAFTLRRFDPDVILLDLAMAALNGDTLLKMDRRRFFPTNAMLILHSGRGRDELAALAEELQVDGFYSKGDELNDLLMRIPRWIDCRRGRDAFAASDRAVSARATRNATNIQPLVVLRVDAEAASRTAPMLQMAGYAVVKAPADDLGCALARSCGAEAIVSELGFRETNEFLAAARSTGVPLLAVSSMPKLLEQQMKDVAVVSRSVTRDELVIAMDRLLIDRASRDVLSVRTLA